MVEVSMFFNKCLKTYLYVLLLMSCDECSIKPNARNKCAINHKYNSLSSDGINTHSIKIIIRISITTLKSTNIYTRLVRLSNIYIK